MQLKKLLEYFDGTDNLFIKKKKKTFKMSLNSEFVGLKSFDVIVQQNLNYLLNLKRLRISFIFQSFIHRLQNT